VSAAFLAGGSLLWLGSLAAVAFPRLLLIPHGHLRAMAAIALWLGWLVPGLAGGIYYLLPRLTGAPLPRERLALAALPALVVLAVAGMVVVGLGWGDGREPLGLPYWLDLPVLAVLLVPAVITLTSLSGRREESLFPSLWFAFGATVWLPGLYLAASVPGLNPLAATLADLTLRSGFLHVWGLGLATGLAYYALVKASDQPLANRQLARVGFWSLLFGAVWSGPAQMVAGPQPEWLQAVAGVLGLALPVAALANATNFAQTIGPRWRTLGNEPVLAAAWWGVLLAVVATLATALAGFRSAAVVVSLTAFTDGVVYLLMLGAIPLLFASFTWHALPNLVGRAVDTRPAARVTRRLAVYPSLTAMLLIFSGLAAGYGFAGGAFTGSYVAVGEGWGQAMGLADLLFGLALIAGIGAFFGQAGLALSLYRALTSGRATMQEVLVTKVVADE
jgi:cbb3-type cytochrome oxidase subunit 1